MDPARSSGTRSTTAGFLLVLCAGVVLVLAEQRYRVVADIRGRPVLLRADLTRDLAEPPC